MPKKESTPQAKALYKKLIENGVGAVLEYWDGHKHIDIAILESNIYIEVDGPGHFNTVRQIEADFNRDHYSEKEGYSTIHISNQSIADDIDRIATAIAKVAKKRSEERKTVLV